MKRFQWDKRYLQWGVTAFLTIAASILFYLLVSNLGRFREIARQVGGILSPFIWGLVIAYLLYPLMKIYSRAVFTPACRFLFRKSKKAETLVPKVSRGLSVFLCILTLLVLIGGVISLVAPQIYSSVETIVVNSSDYIERVDAWLNKTLHDYPELEVTVTGVVGDLSKGVVSWATNSLLPQLRGLITNVTLNVVSVVRSIYNILIGIIVSVYVLYGKEHFAARCKKLIYCVFSLEAAEKLLKAVGFTNEVFMGFLSGKILDSFIVGVICFIGCSVLRMPFALLVSVIVAITNIIPFFGPFIGAIPSAFIILTESPLKALIFLIFIVVLQQFDGNILGPKILGNRVGLNGFWVLFSIILGAGLFGFAGMLLGVPVFVVLYTFIRNLVNRKLARSGLPVDSDDYAAFGYIDPQTGKPVEKPTEDAAKSRRKAAAKKSKKPTGGEPKA